MTSFIRVLRVPGVLFPADMLNPRAVPRLIEQVNDMVNKRPAPTRRSPGTRPRAAKPRQRAAAPGSRPQGAIKTRTEPPEAPQADPLHASFGYWLFQVHRRMHAVFLERLAPAGVTGAQWALLAWLEAGPRSPAAIASRLGVDRAAVSRLIDQLETQGLAARQPGPRDRRVIMVSLTRQGLALLPRLKQISADTNREYLGLLDPEEARQLLMSIRTLGERVETYEPKRLG